MTRKCICSDAEQNHVCHWWLWASDLSFKRGKRKSRLGILFITLLSRLGALKSKKIRPAFAVLSHIFVLLLFVSMFEFLFFIFLLSILFCKSMFRMPLFFIHPLFSIALFKFHYLCCHLIFLFHYGIRHSYIKIFRKKN